MHIRFGSSCCTLLRGKEFSCEGWQEKPFPPEAPEAPESVALGQRLTGLEARNSELQELVLNLAKQNTDLQEAVAKLLEKKAK